MHVLLYYPDSDSLTDITTREAGPGLAQPIPKGDDVTKHRNSQSTGDHNQRRNNIMRLGQP